MFTLEIRTENAAFGETDEDRREELSRLLRQTADRLLSGMLSGRLDGALTDSNGNRVGAWNLTEYEAPRCSYSWEPASTE